MPALFAGEAKAWDLLSPRPDMAHYLWEYWRKRDFPDAFPWEKQSPRWKRAMLVISPIIHLEELRVAAQKKQHSCPFGGSGFGNPGG